MKKLELARIGLMMLFGVSPALVYAQAPNPREVYVNNIIHAGTGCPANTVAGDISEDGKAFTLLFDMFAAEAGPGIPLSSGRKFCQLTVNLHVPQGWTYTLADVTYKGFASLDRGTSGVETSTYYFQGAPSTNVTLTTNLRGAKNTDYEIKDTVPISSLVWAPCGVNRALNIKTSVQVRATRGLQALMTIDSIDGELIHKYGIRWARCR
jgi:hypothetical protein